MLLCGQNPKSTHKCIHIKVKKRMYTYGMLMKFIVSTKIIQIYIFSQVVWTFVHYNHFHNTHRGQNKTPKKSKSEK